MAKKLLFTISLLSVSCLLILGVANTVTAVTEIEDTLQSGLGSGAEGVVKAAPTASPSAGTYSSTQTVTLTSSGSSAICYRTDGTNPACGTTPTTCAAGSTVYSGTISVPSTRTIKAISCYPDSESSSVSSFAYTIETPAPPGGGGSPGTSTSTTKSLSEMTIEELQAEIARITALIAQLQSQIAQIQGGGAASGDACDGITFNRNLSLGMTGNDVKCLQSILNQSADTQVAISGVGSPGNETTYFGSLTRTAVIKFQEKYRSEILTPAGFSSGTGMVGPYTIAKLNSLLGQ